MSGLVERGTPSQCAMECVFAAKPHRTALANPDRDALPRVLDTAYGESSAWAGGWLGPSNRFVFTSSL
jgi:hypothetical protein